MEDVVLSRRRLLLVAALAVGSGGASANRTRGLEAPPPTGFVRLPDGRRVAFAEYGNPKGTAVIVHHHGLPDCRLEAELLAPALARRPDIRLIAFDRPGIGQSDPVRQPSFDSWACDLAACMDALQISRFGITSVSAGTPFALASAIRLGRRVTALSLGCPVAELTRYNDPGEGGKQWRMVVSAPLISRVFLNRERKQLERDPRHIIEMAEPLTPAERQRFDDPEAVEFAARMVAECLRQGSAGVVGEVLLLAHPWGLNLSAVSQPVALFHGDLDRRAPLWMAESLARRLPRATLTRTATDGHLSLPETMAGPMLDAVRG